MADLLLPVEQRHAVLMEEKNESIGSNVQSGESINVEKEIDSTRSNDKTINLGHSESPASTSGVLRKLDDSGVTLTDLLNEPGRNNDTTPNVLKSFLNATGRSSIMKKTQFGNSTRSSRNVSFLSPVADHQNSKTADHQNSKTPVE
ncbi:hypothetical protein LOAG_07691 [Loa loa]|uniref:Uncharacterized protein n=1 Tax=Loa loa TaxID=7209 RepID=A0A1S0TWV5_LOALO|nr:hypothetical protein LOAG_07691 [Loa loa]EFO20799.2 hypothetical protein LOAG_07691 [Loa loa]